MKYLLMFGPHSPSPFAGLDADSLNAAGEKLASGLQDGSLDCAYTKVGGGGFMVVNAKSNESLMRELRLLGITDVDVCPIVETIFVIQGHAEQAMMGPEPFKNKYRAGSQAGLAGSVDGYSIGITREYKAPT